jgi:hypothetical protein
MSYNATSGTFALPGRSTAVFVLPEVVEEAAEVAEEGSEEVVAEATAVTETVEVETAVTPEPEPTATPATADEGESGLPAWLAVAGIGGIVVLVLVWYGRRRNRKQS